MSHEHLPHDASEFLRAEDFLRRGSRGQGPQNLSSDRYERRTFAELLDGSPDAKRLVSGPSAPAAAGPLLMDLYVAYYAAQPDLADEREVERETRLSNRPFLSRMLEDKSFYDARLLTRLDEASSFLAAVCAAEKILQELREHPVPPEPSPAETGGEAGGARGEDRTVPEKDLRRAAREAARAAEDAAEDYAEALSSWGLEPADLSRVPLSDRLELAGRLRSRDLRRLAELAGRMREFARHEARSSVRGRTDEVHSVTLGGDIAKALPSELVSLASPDPLRSTDFYRRLADEEVLSYDLSTDEDAQEGPVVLAIDCSGSMARNGKMDWAVAVALAVVDLCSGRRGGLPEREVNVVFFNTKIVHEERFAPGEKDAAKILSVATVGPNGGTDYGPALRRATRLVEESEDGAADVLFVTDELCRLDDAEAGTLAAKKAELGFSIHAVLIGAGQGEELSRYCESVHPVAGMIGRPGEDAYRAAGGVFGRFL